MSSFKHQNSSARDQSSLRGGNALWYYKECGDARAYLRLTPLAWALLLIPTVLAVLALISLYVYNTLTPTPVPDVTIRPRDTSADVPSSNLIKRSPPAPAPPRVRARTNMNSGSQAASPQPSRNVNGQ
jgi:hypothetical protein